jgi:hypothetical protein
MKKTAENPAKPPLHPEIALLSIPPEEKKKLQALLEKDLHYALATGKLLEVGDVSIAEKNTRDELHLYLTEKSGGESFFHTCHNKEWHIRIHQK